MAGLGCVSSWSTGQVVAVVEVHLALTSRLEAEEAAVEVELVVELDQVAIDNASLLFTILSFISKMEFRTIKIPCIF